MVWESRVHESDLIVEVRHEGECTMSEILASREAVISELLSRGWRMVLVDVSQARFARALSPQETIAYARRYRQEDVVDKVSEVTVAVVLPREAISRVAVRLMARAANNRGLDSKVCENIDEARQWLLANNRVKERQSTNA